MPLTIFHRLLIQSSWRESAGRWLEWLALLGLHAGILLTPIVMRPESSDVFVGPKLALIVLLTAISAIAAGGAQALGRPSVSIDLPDWSALMLAMWATAAWLLSVEPATSLLGEPTQRAGLVSMVALVGAFGTARVVTTSTRRLIGLAITASVAASVVALYGLMQTAGIDPIWVSSPVGRAFSFIGQPNWLGAYLAITIPLTGSLLFATTRPLIRAAVVASLFAQVAVMIGTLSRAGWLGALIGVLVGTLVAVFGPGRVHRVKRATAVLAPVLAIAATAVFVLGAISQPLNADVLMDRLASVPETDSFEVRQRLALWQVALAMTGDSPWFGTGPDTYAVVFPEYRDSVIDAYYAGQLADFRPESSHNAYLDFSVGLGIPGLVAFSALLGFAGARLTRELRRRGTSERLSLGILIGLISHAVAIAFMSIHIVSAWILLALLGAALTAFDSPEDPAPA